MADVLPITVPSRVELWRRLQLARSVLGHREPERELLLRVLDGEPIESLLPRGGEPTRAREQDPA